jgi:hypothetical protein
LLRGLIRGAAVCVTLLSLTASRSAESTLPKIPATAPCGPVHAATYTHVVWIMLENQGYSVVGSPSAPYFNGLIDQCGLATNYFAISHPSLPNYIALTSGSTQGITDDGDAIDHRLAVPSIFSQLGTNWRTLAQSMPEPCDQVSSGLYAARHNPAVYYTTIAACLPLDPEPRSRCSCPTFATTCIVVRSPTVTRGSDASFHSSWKVRSTNHVRSSCSLRSTRTI